MSELETPKAQDLTNLEQLIAQFQNGIILARLEELSAEDQALNQT